MSLAINSDQGFVLWIWGCRRMAVDGNIMFTMPSGLCYGINMLNCTSHKHKFSTSDSFPLIVSHISLVEHCFCLHVTCYINLKKQIIMFSDHFDDTYLVPERRFYKSINLRKNNKLWDAKTIEERKRCKKSRFCIVMYCQSEHCANWFSWS